MPVLFIFAIIFFVIALISGAVALLATGDTPDAQGVRATGIGAAVVAVIVALLFTLFSSIATVGTQDIAVKTSFGRTTGSGITAGWHWKAPWEKLHQLDAKIQTDTYASNGFDGSDQVGSQNGCIKVRISHQAVACVNTVIRWSNKPTGVDYLFQNFKTNDNIRDNLLHRDLQTAVNVAFGKYDPFALDAAGNTTEPSQQQLADTVESTLQSEVGQYLNVQSVQIPLFNFDPKTQDRLNALQLQFASTRIAVAQQQTNKAQAKANRILARSLSHANNQNVLSDKCLNIWKDAVDRGLDLPSGTSCFPNSSSAVAVR